MYTLTHTLYTKVQTFQFIAGDRQNYSWWLLQFFDLMAMSFCTRIITHLFLLYLKTILVESEEMNDS